MNFLEAVKAMKEGKKVRRKAQYKEVYYKLREGKYISKFNGRDDVLLDLRDIEATDWEIYEEKKTLSDKVIIERRNPTPEEREKGIKGTQEKLHPTTYNSAIRVVVEERKYKEEDVKEFIREILNIFIYGRTNNNKEMFTTAFQFENKVKELAGNKLISKV